MGTPSGLWAACFAMAALMAGPVRAQQPAPSEPAPAAPPTAPEPASAQSTPTPVAPTPTPEPIDPTRAAAEILRRRLGLQPGPQGPVPSGPPPGPPYGPELPPGGLPALPDLDPPPVPPPTDPSPSVQDPVRVAAEALRRLLPDATPPAIAPIPDATGTPEPVLPGQEPAPAAPPAAAAVPVAGTLGLRYRARHGAGATDHDVVARWNVDVGNPDVDAWTAHLRARGFWNADGQRAEDPFPGLDHSFGDPWNLRLYAAHFDLHRQLGLGLLRAGRQDLDETPTALSFDGLRADSARYGGALQWWCSGYGGVPVHQFEPRRTGDLVAGFATGCVPWQGSRVRLDAMHLRDEFLALDRRDDLLGLRWWQQLAGLQWHGLHTLRDGRPRDLVLGARGELPWALQLDARWTELLTTQRQQVTEIDPFWLIGFDYTPYRQGSVTLRRDLGAHLTAGIGADLRRLRRDGDERAFNREFERWSLDLSGNDLFVRGLSLGIAMSLWDSTGEDLRMLTGELAYRPDRALRLVLGSSYDLFRYDALDLRERLHVRTWYARAEVRAHEGLSVDGGYELQRDDLDEFHLFRLGCTWTF